MGYGTDTTLFRIHVTNIDMIIKWVDKKWHDI